MAPEVRAVCKRLVVNLENDILNGINFLYIFADGSVRGQFHKPGFVIAQAEFISGAAHTLRLKAVNLREGYLAAGHSAARQREGYFHAFPYIGSGADYVAHPVARVNGEKVDGLFEFFVFGVVLYGQNLTDYNLFDIPALVEDILNLGGREGETAD